MKVFQTVHKYAPYVPYFEQKFDTSNLNFKEHLELLIQDRFYALHILQPALDLTENGFYTLWDYEALQYKWADEQGLKERDLKKILFAQIEAFSPDVFYNCSPYKFEAGEIAGQISDQIKKIAWYAAPTPKNKLLDFTVYGSRLTNVPPDVRSKREAGFRSDLFHPAYDPAMEQYATWEERDIDVFFYGQYTPDFFDNRNALIDQLIDLKREGIKVELALQYPVQYKYDYPFTWPGRIRERSKRITFPPNKVRNNSTAPVYGRTLYEKLSKSKIVFNAAVDFTGNYKVNMRNLESLGCGAHMISDDGIYPDGLIKETHFTTYNGFSDFKNKVKYYLDHLEESREIAVSGWKSVKKNFSKEKQWQRFMDIVESI